MIKTKGYKTNKEIIEQRINDNMQMVRRIAASLISRMPRSVCIDDLHQAGMIGLMEAAQSFEPSSDVSFSSFASFRIKGAMIDEVRKNDWLSRGSRRQAKEIDTAILKLEAELNRPPKESEIAKFLNLSLEDYQNKLLNSKGIGIINFNSYDDDEDDVDKDQLENIKDENTQSPEEILQSKQFKQDVKDAIDALNERELIIMGLYYEKDFNFREIAQILNVSEPRVSQIHVQIMARIRAHLTKKGWL